MIQSVKISFKDNMTDFMKPCLRVERLHRQAWILGLDSILSDPSIGLVYDFSIISVICDQVKCLFIWEYQLKPVISLLG